MLIGHRPAVELYDYVAALDAGLGRWRTTFDIGHQRALCLRKAEGLGEIRRDFLDLDTQPSANHAALALELLHHALGQIDRNREADTGAGAGAAVNRGVDSDHVALVSNNGPPELPGLIEASVWMKSS